MGFRWPAVDHANAICQSPSAHPSNSIISPSLPSHPAHSHTRKPILLPDPRDATRHAILTQTKHGDAVGDEVLPELWAKLRAGVHVHINHEIDESDDELRRQIQSIRGLVGSELEIAVKERVQDLDAMRKWVAKWREKGVTVEAGVNGRQMGKRWMRAGMQARRKP